MVIAPVGTEKGIPAGIKSVDRCIDPIKSKVIAALAVLGLMVDDRIFNLDFADTQISLEVLHIVIRIPKTPFHIRKEGKSLRRIAIIF